jgi:hypothetical protein
MARFNKTAHLRQNIDAIKVAFTLDWENRKPTSEEIETLRAYSGFGAIKEVIDPLPASDNKVKETPLTPLIRELHTVLKENTLNEREYKRYFGGIKDSILSAFYTPPVIVDALVSSLQQSGVTPFRVIDPSAGAGAFADSLRKSTPDAEITCFEKDPATGLILKHLHPENNVRVQGYETIEPKYSGYYDVAASNIPFGDVAIFDPAFSTNTDPVRRQATRTLHNYFFMKSVDTVRDGGIIAFITSQGVLNSEQNRPIREWLAGRCDVVSAIRLPNNLFTATAGTEVGSDLIVLQKRPPGEYAVTQRQSDFIESRKLSNGISVNNLFRQLDRVIQTDAKVGTDPYGKPAMEFTHSGGETGIAEDLRRMLGEDFSKHLDLNRYLSFAPRRAEQTQERNVAAPQIEPEQSTIVDIAGASNKVEADVSTSHRQRPPSEERFPDDLDPFWQAVEEHFEDLYRQDNIHTIIPTEEYIESAEQLSRKLEEREAIEKAWAEGYNLDIDTGELTPTAEDLADFEAWADEQERRLYEEHPPTPEDFGITEPILENPVQATTEPKQNVQATPTGNFSGTLFDMNDPAILSKPTTETAPQINVQQEPLITLYDLFGFSEEERSQISRPRRRKKTAKPKKGKQEEERFIDWREELMINSHREREEKEKQMGQSESGDSRPAYPVEDARKAEQQEALRLEQERIEREEYLKPIPFKAEILPHYREGSLVSDEHNRIGYLRDMNGLQPMFHPLELTETQGTKASIYVEIRDTYYHLYQNEAERLEANPALREMLNRLYDNFTDRFGKLNEKKNLDLIKMDARGTEILSLERYIDGVAQKADIFHHPVAFNPNEITEVADAREALVASLNKYAAVNLEYMAGLTGDTKDNILEELHGSIYFNPEIGGYEIADKYIAGNVIEKAEQVERFLIDNPDHTPAADSLRALREATPKPIAFDDLDFNFGERWIPRGIYEKYASHLFDTEVSINFAPNIDEYSVKADKTNVKITDQYAVKSQSRTFNGIHLMKHALQNTSPDITKKVNKLIDGKMQEVKVRDPEAIQLAVTLQ